MTSDLAILGGAPIRRRPWPTWPRADAGTEAVVTDVLRSSRWALSGPSDGRLPYERRLAASFARFLGAAHCTPVTSGTAALTVALQALGVGPGDEVVVPGLTWVACASSVANLGARPVLVDVDPLTLTLDPSAVAAAVNDRTRAVMVVHLGHSLADLDAFTELSQTTSLPLIEDCAQAHGARWRGRRVGTFGAIGCFSMQQSKLLTAGEGGVAVTDDAMLHDRMEQLRSDGRRVHAADRPGQLELVEVGEVQGRNLCLSELQAAVLCDRLAHLDAENSYRRVRAAELAALLEDVPGVNVLPVDERVTEPTYYNTVIRLDLEDFSHVSVDLVARALSAELGDLEVHPVYRPLNQHPLLCPERANPGRRDPADVASLALSGTSLPHAEEARRTCLTLGHRMLLDNPDGMAQVAETFAKVSRLSTQLVGVDGGMTARAF